MARCTLALRSHCASDDDDGDGDCDDGGDFPPLNIISGGLAKDGDAEEEEHPVVLAQEMMKKGI